MTLDFTDAFHIQVENSNDMKIQAVVGPMTTDTIAVIRAYEESWSNQCRAM